MAGGDVNAWARLIVNSLWGCRLSFQLSHTAWTHDKCPPWKKVATVRNCRKSFYISLSQNQILSSWIYRPFYDFLFSMPCYSWPYPLWDFARTWGTKNTNRKVRRGPRALHTNTKSEGGYKKGLPSPQIRHQDFLLTEVSKSSPSLQKIGNVPLRTMRTALKTL